MIARPDELTTLHNCSTPMNLNNQQWLPILEQIRNGNMDAFDLLYRETYEGFFCILMDMLQQMGYTQDPERRRQDAEDFLHDFYFIFLARKNDGVFRANTNLSFYLNERIRFLMRDKVKKIIRTDRHMEDYSHYLGEETYCQSEMDYDASLILELIARLPAHKQQMLELAMKGQSGIEISETVGESSGKVNLILHRTRKNLKRKLVKMGLMLD
ncbi:MAG: sigma-70 family RNA polymerase sigma factor [Bacteroidota bacterium]